MNDLHDKATEYVAQFLNGNRNSTCLEILAGPNPAVVASLVTRELARFGDDADIFIRLLEGIVDSKPTVVNQFDEDVDDHQPIRACDRGMN